MRVLRSLVGAGALVDGLIGSMLLLTPGTVAAQPAAAAAALKAALEGREVTVLMDMPATSAGVDLYLQREPDIDAASYGLRLKQTGTAIHRGDRVRLTLVKVNKKNIELQLAGGGYGTRGDDTGLVVPAYAATSTREKDLEKERDRTRDAKRRRDLDRELAALRDERERGNLAAIRRADVEMAVKKEQIAQKRLERGSRFNVWYPDKRLEQWVPTPQDLMLSLTRYLDFADPRLMSLRKGMKTAEVYDLLGFPSLRRPSREGDFDASLETWETRRDLIEVTFVAGVVVKISTSQR